MHDKATPHIERLDPAAALPGGEVRILGRALRPDGFGRPRVEISGELGPVIISSDHFVVAKVPDDAVSGSLTVTTNGASSNAHDLRVAGLIAENVHPVSNPAVDAEGNIFVTLSGQRGQKTPVSVYKIDTSYAMRPFVSDVMNATAITFDRAGQMYVSSRHEGSVYRVAPNGTMTTYAESLGVATGIAFDDEENLYVGDRSGTIFKIARDKQIFVFATLEPSVAAYHLAFGVDGHLYVSGPTTSSYDAVYRIDPHGATEVFYRGLGRPQGIAFDVDGNLYVAASLNGRRGIVRITPQKDASLVVSGNNLVGLAFAPGRSAVLATNNAVYNVFLDVQGREVR